MGVSGPVQTNQVAKDVLNWDKKPNLDELRDSSKIIEEKWGTPTKSLQFEKAGVMSPPFCRNWSCGLVLLARAGSGATCIET